MKVRVHPLRNSVPIPCYETEGSACFDLRADINYDKRVEVVDFSSNSRYFPAALNRLPGNNLALTMHLGRYYKIPTGLVFEIPEGYAMRIFMRSSASYNRGLRLINSVAIIDSDYRDEVFLLVACDQPYHNLMHGERIAQAELYRTEKVDLKFTDVALDRIPSREGGIGSTGCE